VCAQRGRVRQLVDAAGTVRSQYEYDPYGNETKLGGDLASDVGFAGYFNVPASSLQLAVYRAYDPAHSRWLNRDPMGESGGINLYEYVHDNPVNRLDPLGLIDICAGKTGVLGWICNNVLKPKVCKRYGQSSEAACCQSEWNDCKADAMTDQSAAQSCKLAECDAKHAQCMAGAGD
jgi:RHS repeat-associated protein